MSPQVAGLEDMTVSDLFIPGLYEWDLNIIEEYFCERDVNQILRIPLYYSDEKDSIIWHHSKTGAYTVKSGYKLLVNSIIDEQLGTAGAWRKIWQMKVPSKIKFFLWRACTNCLPTRSNLAHKGINITQVCVICENQLENNFHMFLSCKFAIECWRFSHYGALVNRVANTVESFASWFFKMMEETTPSILAKVSMVLWSIWKQRNSKLWKNHYTNAAATVKNALDFLDMWIDARLYVPLQSEMTISPCKLWHPPQSSTLKCNIDAAFFRDQKRVGIGMVLRDDIGHVLLCRTCWFLGDIDVLEGESRGLLEGLQWVRSLGFFDVIFGVDAKGIVDVLNDSEEIWTEVGKIIRVSKTILSSEPLYRVQYVSRQANIVAHALARASNSHASPTIWVEPSDFVVAHLNYFMMVHFKDISSPPSIQYLVILGDENHDIERGTILAVYDPLVGRYAKQLLKLTNRIYLKEWSREIPPVKDSKSKMWALEATHHQQSDEPISLLILRRRTIKGKAT
ncbi:hypothetical protein DH2020_021709 [Rehmannia glutinosa]|uniref:Uncharacterized protein n=1 Tax=Rehmannia glutinosa TaxID=99300 RepID=A0ABR0WFP0_REHGL